ncbi:MAG: 2,3-bisphosphoglycerate-independent phosphoglycerate mutase, partial [Candidatus Woesearchaeota archaeon]
IKQEITRINEAIANGSFFRNKTLLSAMKKIKKNNGKLHLMGLLSDAGVHSHISHLFALMKLARKLKLPLYIHIFTDGRDTPQKSAIEYIKQLRKKMYGEQIATVIGRYYAMDRDKRWNRTKKAYEAITAGKGLKAKTPEEAVKKAYTRGERDEFIKPTIIDNYDGLKDGDGFIFYNYREDRARQITLALAKEKFGKNKKTSFTCMYEYDKSFNLPVAFEKPKIKNVLAEVLSKQGLKQFHIAETEKYAHVTYFFNGGTEKAFKGEDRMIIPSPKVATYDKTPGMSASKITSEVLKRMNKYDFIIVNFANPDMVGHTGNLKAAIKAVETTDTCIGLIAKKTLDLGGNCIITADHGNCEEMTGKFKTSHTLNDVPCILLGRKEKLQNGKLGEIAPTILKLMGIKKPKEMGTALF